MNNIRAGTEADLVEIALEQESQSQNCCPIFLTNDVKQYVGCEYICGSFNSVCYQGCDVILRLKYFRSSMSFNYQEKLHCLFFESIKKIASAILED